MKWYLAKIVFRIVNNEHGVQQFDEQLRLIEAYDDHQAFIKATQIGKQEEETFMTQAQKTLKWLFVNVSDLNLIKGFQDGIEIHSFTNETEDADEYTMLVNRRADIIQSRALSKELTTAI